MIICDPYYFVTCVCNNYLQISQLLVRTCELSLFDFQTKIITLKKQTSNFDPLRKRAAQQSTEYDQLIKERDTLLKKCECNNKI